MVWLCCCLIYVGLWFLNVFPLYSLCFICADYLMLFRFGLGIYLVNVSYFSCCVIAFWLFVGFWLAVCLVIVLMVCCFVLLKGCLGFSNSVDCVSFLSFVVILWLCALFVLGYVLFCFVVYLLLCVLIVWLALVVLLERVFGFRLFILVLIWCCAFCLLLLMSVAICVCDLVELMCYML